MARASAIQETLENAAGRVRREVLLSVIASLPSATTVDELHHATVGGPFEEAFARLTVGELAAAMAGTTSRRKKAAPTLSLVEAPSPTVTEPPKQRVNTRTRSGRAILDTAVRDHLVAEGPSTVEGIARAVAGDEGQVRQSLARLVRADEVLGSGIGPATIYSVTSAIAAFASASATAREMVAVT